MPARMLRAAHEQDAASIVARLAERGLEFNTWSGGPNVGYSPHRHADDKLLYCLHGRIRFELGDTGERIALRSSDDIELPRGTTHAAVAGPDGVTCAEAAAGAPAPDG